MAGETAHATLFLPDGPVEIVVEAPLRKGDAFRPFSVSEDARRRIESCLYAVSWHREFLHHDAEFATPLSALARLVPFGHSTNSRVRWQAAGLAQSAAGGTSAPVVLQGHSRGRAEMLIAFQPLTIGAQYAVQSVSGRRPRTRMIQIEAVGEERTLYAVDGGVPRTYRYQVAEVASEHRRSRPRLVRPQSRRPLRPAAAAAIAGARLSGEAGGIEGEPALLRVEPRSPAEKQAIGA